jgi:hypothetical protein
MMPQGYFVATTEPLAAFSMREATAWGFETYMAWLPLTSTTLEPACWDIARWASGGIILSSVEIKYQLGFIFHAGSLIVPLSASRPHGTWESAINRAVFALTSAANDVGNFSLSRRDILPAAGESEARVHLALGP